jgi:hypothetical protein
MTVTTTLPTTNATPTRSVSSAVHPDPEDAAVAVVAPTPVGGREPPVADRAGRRAVSCWKLTAMAWADVSGAGLDGKADEASWIIET